MISLWMEILLGVGMASAILILEWYYKKSGRELEDGARICYHVATALILTIIFILFTPYLSHYDGGENLGWSIVIISAACLTVLCSPSVFRLVFKKPQRRRGVRS